MKKGVLMMLFGVLISAMPVHMMASIFDIFKSKGTSDTKKIKYTWKVIAAPDKKMINKNGSIEFPSRDAASSDELISKIQRSLNVPPGEDFTVSCDAGEWSLTNKPTPVKWKEISACNSFNVILPGPEQETKKVTKKKYAWQVTAAVDEKKA